ncbi:MAG: sigma-54-dependent transcriptional regulator [Myxococcota bacterium]
MNEDLPRILVVDDEPQAVDLVAIALRKIAAVERAGSGDEAWAKLQVDRFDAVISDQRMPGMSGLELFDRIIGLRKRVGRILVTAHAEIADTIAAINEGRIHAYLSKPTTPDEIRETTRSVLELVERHEPMSPRLLGDSRVMRELRARVARIARARFPVLVLGETGTGKELVARSLHEQSPRRDAPFVAINCGSLAESLLETELFGHCRGAFTGADKDKPGLFELADGGTLFLDEIGDTSPALQVRLLRVLETQETRRVGDTRTRKVDVRLVSATHRDIDAMVKEGDFRQDLFYRLNTIQLHLPPLRARREDVRLLAVRFADECSAIHGTTHTLSEECLETLERMELPGNIRELRHVVERGIAMALPASLVEPRHVLPEERADDEGMGDDDAPASDRPFDPAPRPFPTLKERVEAVQVDAIREALACFDGNRTRTAAALGLSRPGLTKMMRRLGIDPGDPA